MIKFVVNQLPYYGELCPLWTMCSKNAKEHECPRYWDKYKVCSDETHMNVSTLLRQRNSNKCSCTKKTPPIMKGGNAQ